MAYSRQLDASGAILLLNLIHVTESISGSVVPLAMFNANRCKPVYFGIKLYVHCTEWGPVCVRGGGGGGWRPNKAALHPL